MSFFSRLFKPKLPPPPPIHHDGLGELIGFRAPNGNICHWETATPVQTPIGALKIQIESGSDGPTTEQSKLWQMINGDIRQFEKFALPFITEGLTEVEPDIASELLKPNRIHLWDQDVANEEWSLVFLYSPKLWEFTVTFVGQSVDHTDFDRL